MPTRRQSGPHPTAWILTVLIAAVVSGCAPGGWRRGSAWDRRPPDIEWRRPAAFAAWSGGSKWEESPPAGDARYLDWMIAQLASEDRAWREEIANRIAELGPRAAPATDALIAMLNKPSFVYQSARDDWVPLLRHEPDPEGGAVVALAAIGPAAVPSLIRALAEGDDRTRAGAAAALGRALADRRVCVSGPWFPSSYTIDESVTEGGCRLGEPWASAAEGPLIRALSDRDPMVRMRAAEALGRMLRPAAADPLARRLEDEHHGVRWNAAVALGSLGDRRAIDPLIEYYPTGSWRRETFDFLLRRLTGHEFPRGPDHEPPTAEQWRAWWHSRSQQPASQKGAEDADTHPTSRPVAADPGGVPGVDR